MPSIIPQNFDFKAAMKNPQAVPHFNNPAQAPTNFGIPQRVDSEFMQGLYYELEASVNAIIDTHRGEAVDDIKWNQIKQEIRNKFTYYKNKYNDYINTDILGFIYNSCMTNYTTTWVMNAGNCRVNDLSGTEYCVDEFGNIYYNPFIIYSIFNGNATTNIIINE